MSTSRTTRLTLVVFSLISFAASGSISADVYVSPTGNDANTGTEDQPLQTLHRACEVVRRQIAQSGSLRATITVWLGDGTYPVDHAIELSSQDSGTKDAPICYRAKPRAVVRLSGGRQIPPDALRPVQDAAILERLDPAARGHVLQVDLTSLGIGNFGGAVPDGKHGELFFNDRPLTVARWPNAGFATVVDVAGGQPISSHGIAGDTIGKFIYDGDRPSRWTKEKDAWAHGYWFWDWADGFQRLASIDTATKVIELTPPHHNYGHRKGQKYYVLNVLAELDQPGEWCLDRQTGLLYVWPPEPVENARIVFSTLEEPVIRLSGVSHVILRDLIVENARGDGIEIQGGQSNRVAGCTVRNLGGSAIVIRGGRDNGAASCDVYQVNTGIRIDGGDRRTLTPAGNYAANNHIHDFARLRRTYMPAIELSGVGNRADHNLVHDAPHWAISFGGNENLMEFNEIHHVCQETGDVGVFYTGRDWTVRGNVIRYNFIHDVHGPGLGGAQGVYLDDCASGTTVFGNLIYKTSRAMLIGGGRDNVIENNLMLDCGESIRFDNRGLNWMQYHVAPDGIMPKRLAESPYRQPPWSERYPQLLTLLDDDPGSPKGNTIRRNVVSRCQPMGLAEEVTQHGTVSDNVTIDGDLGFRDAGAMDFRLRDDSPVLKKLPAFEKIPFEQIGLRIDEYRETLPADTSR